MLLLGIEVCEFLLVPVPDDDARSLHRWRQEFILNGEGFWREEDIFRLNSNTIIEVRKIELVAHVGFDWSTRSCHVNIDLFITTISISLRTVLTKTLTRINSVSPFRLVHSVLLSKGRYTRTG